MTIFIRKLSAGTIIQMYILEQIRLFHLYSDIVLVNTVSVLKRVLKCFQPTENSSMQLYQCIEDL